MAGSSKEACKRLKLASNSGFSSVVDGRFKGGWITRSLGRPGEGIHAIQMELACRGYLDEVDAGTPLWSPTRAAPMRQVLQTLLAGLITGVERLAHT